MNENSENSSHLLIRAQGAWLGQFIGDALGSQVEFQSAGSIRERYPDGLRTLGPSSIFDTVAGQPTDDSELALVQARSLVKHGAYDREDVIDGYCWWLESDPFDLGSTVGRALRAALAAPPNTGHAAASEKGADPESQSNGALMRQSPLAIWGHALPSDDLARIVREDTRLTHPSAICQDASVCFVLALAAALGQGLNAEQTYEAALRAHGRYGSLTRVTDALEAARTEPPRFQPHEGWVLIALQNAFYQALHAESFEQGLVATVMGGGDTDTNAAIAGGLLGGIYGLEAIPPRWIDIIVNCRPSVDDPAVRTPRPERLWPCDALSLAAELAHAATGGTSKEPAWS